MGIFSWFSRGTNTTHKKEQPAPPSTSAPKPEPAEAPGMNGAVEVRRPFADISVFEFGSVAASADKVTLAGYCPVSDELDPCRWEILPASASDAPQFRLKTLRWPVEFLFHRLTAPFHWPANGLTQPWEWRGEARLELGSDAHRALDLQMRSIHEGSLV